jgi:threonine/homoserine/homoserine lactone efflux protein
MAFDLSQYTSADPHLSSGERLVSVLAGLALTSVAAQPRSNVFFSILALAGGSYLAYRGATGFCVVKASLNDEHAAPPVARRLGS